MAHRTNVGYLVEYNESCPGIRRLRALIVGDIHSNLEAFQAVLEDSQAQGGFDEIWCLGDLVGYGPDPVACIQLLRQHTFVAVAGNHDRAAVGMMDLHYFNPLAAEAVRWTTQQLGTTHIQFLASLPEVAQKDRFTLVHGSLREPLWEYLLSPEAAQATFQRLESPFCLVGPLPHPLCVCVETEGGPRFARLPEGKALRLDIQRLIINPGGVGQPRDGDPRASYALYDSQAGTLLHRRVAYDVETTQEKVRRAGLPEHLAERLSYGR